MKKKDEIIKEDYVAFNIRRSKIVLTLVKSAQTATVVYTSGIAQTITIMNAVVGLAGGRT